MLWRYSCYLQRLKCNAKHNNIVVFAMLWRYAWYLQRLKYTPKHNSIVVFAMFRRYSWYFQCFNYDAKHNNVIVFAMLLRYSWYLQPCAPYRSSYEIGSWPPERRLASFCLSLLIAHGTSREAEPISGISPQPPDSPPAPQIRCKTVEYRCICNVLEVFMVPPAPQIRRQTQK